MFDKQQILPMACDHGGFEMKEFLKTKLGKLGYQIKDMGAFSMDSVDYPDMIHPLAKAVNDGEFMMGIILCGSGNGINMVTNKHQGVRGALCWNKEIARLARSHNDANICSLPARFVNLSEAKEIVDVFLNTEFGSGRHKGRIKKIPVHTR